MYAFGECVLVRNAFLLSDSGEILRRWAACLGAARRAEGFESPRAGHQTILLAQFRLIHPLPGEEKKGELRGGVEVVQVRCRGSLGPLRGALRFCVFGTPSLYDLQLLRVVPGWLLLPE